MKIWILSVCFAAVHAVTNSFLPPSQNCNKPCTRNFKPVCGTDGRTYTNECVLNNAICRSNGKLKKEYDGICQENCNKPCTRNFTPVCGTDGRTYPNECVLNNAICRSNGKLKKEYDGKCQGNPICPFHNPCAGVICGLLRKCVPNFSACAFSCQPLLCQKKLCFSPVCSTNNPCKQKDKCLSVCGGCTAVCEIKRTCEKVCLRTYKPVCGNDGNVYSNDCVLSIATCKSGGIIRKKYSGHCKRICPSICPAIHKPVCGTDGKTYSNECQLNIEFCKSQGKIKKTQNGPCRKLY